MPSVESILIQASRIATRYVDIAILWHALIAFALAAVIAGWRPPRRVAAALLVAPLLSVSALAWSERNPVNGTLFLLLSAALAVIASRMGDGRIARGPAWTTAAGVAMTAFGWAYPHFLDGASPLAYLYAAPTGLLPCPTLSLVIGLTLVAGGLESRAWSGVLAAAGLLYGAVGALQLGVRIDALLVLGGAALLVLAALPRRDETTAMAARPLHP